VVIIISQPERLVHVYRNGALIGISTCRVGSRRARTGVFQVSHSPQQARTRVQRASADEPDEGSLTWWAKAVFGSIDGRHVQECVHLPIPFARLLSGVTQPGSLVIVADERTHARTFVHQTALLLALTADQTTPSGRASVLRSASGIENGHVPATVLVSRKERQALLLRDGSVVARTPVKFDASLGPLGTHVFTLLETREAARGLHWLGFGIGQGSSEPHLKAWHGEAALSRITLASPDLAPGLAHWMETGSSLVVTDAPITLPRGLKPREFPILSISTPPDVRSRSAGRTNRPQPRRDLWAAFFPNSMR
jgi:hypothetical protein